MPQNQSDNEETLATFSARISAVLALLPSRKNAAEIAGVTAEQLNRYIKGESKPPFEVMARLAEATNTSLDWLARGQGQLPTPPEVDHALAVQAGRIGETVSPASLEERFVLVPRYAVRASAGAGALIESEQIVDHLAFKAEWLRARFGTTPERLALIEAHGDSMEPTIRPADLLLVDLAIQGVRENALHVLGIEGALVVKRLQRLTDGSVILSSDNPAYQPERLPRERTGELQVVGRVVWIGRSV